MKRVRKNTGLTSGLPFYRNVRRALFTVVLLSLCRGDPKPRSALGAEMLAKVAESGRRTRPGGAAG